MICRTLNISSCRFLVGLLLGVLAAPVFAGSGQVDLTITDADTGKPIGARVTVRDGRGRTKRFPNCVWQGEATYVFYQANLKLPEGTYQFQVDAGPEYRLFSGNFDVMSGAESTQPIKMERTVDLDEEGWQVAEINVFGAPDELGVILDSLGVDLGAWNPELSKRSRSRGKSFHAPTEPESRLLSSTLGKGNFGGGFHMIQPEAQPTDVSTKEIPEVIEGIEAAIRWKKLHRNGLVIADSALANELPLWLGLELIDGIGLIPWFIGELAEQIPGRGYNIDRKMLRDNLALAHWNEKHYYELLECGFKLPVTATSQWKTSKQPLGTNRLMLATTDSATDPLVGLRVGETWVTNGPLVRIRANGQLPGHTFTAEQGGNVSLNLSLRVSTRYRLAPLQIVKNGEVIQTVDLRELVKNRGIIPSIPFEESGWLLVRAAAEDQKNYRAAITSPFYVEINQKPRVNTQAVQAQIERLEKLLKEEGEDTLPEEILRKARKFWHDKLEN